jgi:phosphoribosylanthranilate isomerase
VDRDAALAAGASALGFIAYPKSPRYIPPARVAELVDGVDPAIDRVAVFVNPTLDEIRPYTEAGISVLQLHGGETPAFAEEAAVFGRIWKAFALRTAEEIDSYLDYPAERFLIDAYSEKAHGGTGTLADWGLAAEAVERLPRPVLLAGGLTPGNVADAITTVQPAGLDLSSGVEVSPGIKDSEKIQAFMAAIATVH